LQTIVAVEKLKITTHSEYVFAACFPARNAHASYCHLWPARLYSMFPHYLIKGKFFEETLLSIKCVIWMYLQIFLKQFSF